MKKIYEKPQIEIQEYSVEDAITTSIGHGNEGGFGDSKFAD